MKHKSNDVRSYKKVLMATTGTVACFVQQGAVEAAVEEQ